MKPLTALELEIIFEAACQHFVDKAREHELDFIRHSRFSAVPPAHTSIADTNRKHLENAAAKEAAQARKLAEVCRQLREKCHEKGLSDILSAL